MGPPSPQIHEEHLDAAGFMHAARDLLAVPGKF